jgi:hypothetical protein
MSTLQSDAEALLATMPETTDRAAGGKLTAEDRSLILRLAAKGHLTQTQIATAVGCSQATVSRVLALLDTRGEARTILESGAARLAQTIVETDDAGIALRALGKLDVVRDDRAEAGGPQFIVRYGVAPAPKWPPEIEASVAFAKTEETNG